jgi:hypothetical protein
MQLMLCIFNQRTINQPGKNIMTIKKNSIYALISASALLLTQGAQAQSSSDLKTLQAQVDSYLSSSMISEVDGLTNSYKALKIGQTYTSDSPKLGPTKDGNADSTSTKMTYSAKSASQLIGYSADQCANHVAYETLVSKGVKVDQVKFNNVRDKFCNLVNAAAELKHRYDKYQAIKTNGITLAKRSKSQKHDFKDRTRTFGVGMDLVYKPDVANTLENGLHLDEVLNYNSWIKWSDDNPTNLNIIKKIREMNNSNASRCDGISFHVIDGKEVDGWLYLNVVNVSSSKITIQNCAKVDYNKTHKTHSFPELTVDAPFGYLYELEQMKDSSKVKLKDDIKNKVVSMIGANSQMITLLQRMNSSGAQTISK